MSHNKNNQVKITLTNHREIWAREHFLRTTFNVATGKSVFEDFEVKNFRKQIEKIPIQSSYVMIGYGSLMNKGDVPRTCPNAKYHRLGVLQGYERIFNMGWGTSFLNVRETENEAKMQVALVDIPFHELPSIIKREGNYEFITVKVMDIEMEEIVEALMVVSVDHNINDALAPQLNYTHLCLSGIKALNGINGVNNFLNTTYCYSEKSHSHVKLDKWLSEMDVINHMFMNDYSSR